MMQATEQQTVVQALNDFLKGRYMGIHALEHYIGRMEDSEVKRVLERIQLDHKRQAEQVAERIHALGGQAATDVGFGGKIAEVLQELKGYPDTRDGIIESCLKGESKYGIGKSEEIVRGDLDEESMTLIKRILDQDRRHVEQLRGLLPH